MFAPILGAVIKTPLVNLNHNIPQNYRKSLELVSIEHYKYFNLAYHFLSQHADKSNQ